MAEVAALSIRFELPFDDSRMVGYSEVILGRDLPAGELEICWEIPISTPNYRFPRRPSPVKSSYRNVASCPRRDPGPHSDNPVYQALGIMPSFPDQITPIRALLRHDGV
jgi:hypothetical protein